jgi:hypothetical protein
MGNNYHLFFTLQVIKRLLIHRNHFAILSSHDQKRCRFYPR